LSKTKGQTFRYRFWNETNMFLYHSRICLTENRFFRFGPESALLDQIEMISFDKTIRERTQTFWFHSYEISESLWNVYGTFVERLFLYCFDGGGPW
jgi:hypothetical protein